MEGQEERQRSYVMIMPWLPAKKAVATRWSMAWSALRKKSTGLTLPVWSQVVGSLGPWCNCNASASGGRTRAHRSALKGDAGKGLLAEGETKTSIRLSSRACHSRTTSTGPEGG